MTQRLRHGVVGETWVLDIPGRQWPSNLVSMNQLRGHSKHLQRLTAPWRDLGRLLGANALRKGTMALLPPGVRIWAETTHPDNRRRDASNIAPTLKALIDGVTDTGILADDCDGLIEGPWPRRVYPNGPAALALVFEVVGPERLGQSKRQRGQ